MMESKTLTFEMEKETKNTIRFQEKPTLGSTALVIGTLYIQKWAIGEEIPKTLTVTVG